MVKTEVKKKKRIITTIINSNNTIYAVFKNGRNMHVYVLTFHCLLDKEMEIYVTCILEVMKWLCLRYQSRDLIKMHKRLAKALACTYPFLSKLIAL